MPITKLRPTFTFHQERVDTALTDEAKVRLEDGRRVKVI